MPKTTIRKDIPGALSKTELAAALGLSMSTINNYIQDGMPAVVQGRQGVAALFDLDEVKAWLPSKKNNKKTDEINEARLEKLRIETQLAEIDLCRERGELIEIDEAIRQLDYCLSLVKSKLLVIPTKYSGIIYSLSTQTEVQQILDDAVRDILNDLITEITSIEQ